MTATGSSDPILIAGGGIGGLSAGLALARAGFRARVLERAQSFEEAGAGIQLGPNATRILQDWGVWEALAPARVAPQAVHIHDGLAGGRLATIALGQAEARYGAPYAAVHRADLQQALLSNAKAAEGLTVSTGFEVAEASQSARGVEVNSTKGKAAAGRALIGADGLRSRVRAQFGLGPEPVYSGQTAWRALAPIAARPKGFGASDIGLWLGPGAHLVHYPVKGGKALNLVAVVDEPLAYEGWNAPGERAELIALFTRWDARARALLGVPAAWRKWALAEARPLEAWSSGRVTLLGDAAHPILPFFAQGGAMAIEDAAALADALAGAATIEAAFARYQRARGARTARVQARSKRQGRIYHLKGPMRLARNWTLRLRSGEALLADLDWLYGTRPAGGPKA